MTKFEGSLIHRNPPVLCALTSILLAGSVQLNSVTECCGFKQLLWPLCKDWGRWKPLIWHLSDALTNGLDWKQNLCFREDGVAGAIGPVLQQGQYFVHEISEQVHTQHASCRLQGAWSISGELYQELKAITFWQNHATEVSALWSDTQPDGLLSNGSS